MPIAANAIQIKRKVFNTVSANANNYVLNTQIGTFTDSIDAFWTINSGVVIGDSGSLGYAANTGTSWPSGSNVWLTNNGTIQGKIGTTGSPGANGSGGTGGTGGGTSIAAGNNGTSGGNGTTGGTGGTGGTAIIFHVKSYVNNGNGSLIGGAGGPGGPGGAGGGGGGGGGGAYVT